MIACLTIILLTASCAVLNNGKLNQNPPTGSRQIEKEPQKVSIGYKKHIAYVPFFVAMDKGFFTNNNLTVNPVAFESTNQMLGSIISGQIDASIGGANLPTILSLTEKSPSSIKIFSDTKAPDNALLTCVMVKKNSALMNLKDLAGKKIAVWPGGFSLLWLEDTLNTINLKSSEVNVVALEDKLQLAALESKQVDAIFTIEPLCTFGVNKGLGKIIYDNPLDNTTKIFAASIISNNLITNSNQAAASLVKSINEAIDFIKNNPEESLAIMANWTGYDKELIKGIAMPEYSKSDRIDIKGIEDLSDKLREKKLLENKINFSGLIY